MDAEEFETLLVTARKHRVASFSITEDSITVAFEPTPPTYIVQPGQPLTPQQEPTDDQLLFDPYFGLNDGGVTDK